MLKRLIPIKKGGGPVEISLHAVQNQIELSQTINKETKTIVVNFIDKKIQVKSETKAEPELDLTIELPEQVPPALIEAFKQQIIQFFENSPRDFGVYMEEYAKIIVLGSVNKELYETLRFNQAIRNVNRSLSEIEIAIENIYMEPAPKTLPILDGFHQFRIHLS